MDNCDEIFRKSRHDIYKIKDSFFFVRDVAHMF